jgi:genome maintenance exonuclease 1
MAPYKPQVKELDGLRYYQIDNDWYPSVTSILHASSTPTPYAQRSRISAGDARARGSAIHYYCERRLHGQRVATAIPDDLRPFWESLQPALKQIRSPQAVEKFVWHRTQRYAGTFDALATFRGTADTLIDYKTSANPDRLTVSQLRSYSLQLAAYAGAIKDTMSLDVNQALLLIAHPDGKAIEIVLTRDDLAILWPEWVALRQSLGSKLEARQAARSAVVTAFNWS